MAQVTLPPFIKSISGRLGNVCFRSYASGRIGCYRSSATHPNPTPTDTQIQVRNLFAERAQRVLQLLQEEPNLTKKQAWKIVKNCTS